MTFTADHVLKIMKKVGHKVASTALACCSLSTSKWWTNMEKNFHRKL